MTLSSLSPEGLASPAINGHLVPPALTDYASSRKGNFCACKTTFCFKGCSLCFVCLIIAFCPWLPGAWLSEAGMFSPAVWSRGQRPRLGSSSHSAQASLCALHLPAPGLMSETKGSQLSWIGAGLGLWDRQHRWQRMPLSPSSVTLSAPKAEAESCKSPQSLQGNQKPRSRAGQARLWGTVLGVLSA